MKGAGNKKRAVGAGRKAILTGLLTVVFWWLPGGSGGAQDAATVKDLEPNRGGELSLEAQDPAVALQRLIPAEGFEVNLFASEKEFPIGNPVSLTFDSRGRLWVATLPSYPQYLPGHPPDDKLIILEDTDGDGRADKHTVFADGLYLPTGFELGDGGVYVAQQPNLVFLKDSDGDDVADERHVILHGFGTEDSHHAISVFTWDPGGALYFQEGTFHHSQVETPWGPVRLVDAGVFRFEPRSYRLSVFVSYGFANPWGHVFDRWGQNFIADASNGNNYFAAPFSGHVEYPRKHPPMKVFTPNRVRPTSGCEIVSSRHFPDSLQGNFLINNTIGFHGIKQHEIIEEGSGFTAREVEPLLRSSDINFRPVDLQFGPDGALYVVDWFNPLVGHMQYSLRDPRRDHTHGRIWRITYKHKPLLTPPQIAGQSLEGLLELLKEYEDRTRYRVRRELRERDSEKVEAALEKWVASLDPGEKDYDHHLLEALWVYQSLDRVKPGLLKKVLASKEFRARAAATRVLRYWLDRVGRPMELLRGAVNDPHPRVRLEGVVALSFLPQAEAAEVALEAVRHPMDYYLDYGLKETLATLEPYWKPLLSAGKPFAEDNPEGLQFALDTLPVQELLSVGQRVEVFRTVLGRPGVEERVRKEALEQLARRSGREPVEELLEAIGRTENREPEAASDLVKILAGRSRKELEAHRQAVETLALRGGSENVRSGAFAALLKLDDEVDAVWNRARSESRALEDLLRAVPLLSGEARASLYPRVRALLEGGDSGDSMALAVRRAAVQALPYFSGQEKESLDLLERLIAWGPFQQEAAAAIRLLPEGVFEQRPLSVLVSHLTEYASRVPVEERDSSDFRSLVDFSRRLANQLPGDQGPAAVRALDDLLVQVVYIRAVKEELRFDKTDFRVEAARPVEIVFENPDVMPHNLLIVRPGSLEEVGRAADAMAADDPKAFEKHFIPETPKVLHATPLITTGQTFRLRFYAPEEPGAYPYVCTFPGHWLTMNGMMHVRTPSE